MLKNIPIKRLMVLSSVILLLTLSTLAAVSTFLLNGVSVTSANNSRLVHAMLLAKEARFQTVQIQQFLTDAGASGEAEALKEGALARDAAQKALRELALQAPSKAARLGKIDPQLSRLYEIGEETARAYISGGRDAGNAIMKRKGDGLDDFAERLAAELDGIVADLQNELDASESRVQNNISRTLSIVLWSSLTMIGFTALLMRLLFVRTIAPMRSLRDSMRGVAQGDGDLTVKLPVIGRNEIADVSDNFNIFIGRMLDLIQQVARNSLRLAETGNHLSLSSEKTADGMRLLRQETESVTASTSELAVMSQGVSANANEAQEDAGKASDEAHKGREVISGTMAAIHRLSGEVQRAASTIDELQTDVADVAKTLGVIKEIAAQTNLLALNAAIEAARAGEQGRGFAVVADEVRKLAQRTQESTQQIEQVIQKLTSGAGEAVTVMRAGRDVAVATVEQTTSAETSLGQIIEAVDRISERNRGIAEAVERQRHAAETIDASIARILELAEQTTGEAHETSRRTADMASLLQELGSVVQQFKTERQG